MSFPFTIAVTVFGWVTLVFALLDLNLPRLLEHAWADLKGVTLPRPEGKGRRWTLLAEIVGSSVFLIWWLAIPQSPVPASSARPPPSWRRRRSSISSTSRSPRSGWPASWCSGRCCCAPTGRACGRSAASLTDGLSLVLAAILLRADAVVQLAPGVEATDKLVEVVRFINAQARIVVLIWLLAATWQIVYSIYRIVTASSTDR